MYQLRRNGIIVYEGTEKSFTDTELIPGKQYQYTLVEFNKFGKSVEKALSLITKNYSTKLPRRTSKIEISTSANSPYDMRIHIPMELEGLAYGQYPDLIVYAYASVSQSGSNLFMQSDKDAFAADTKPVPTGNSGNATSPQTINIANGPWMNAIVAGLCDGSPGYWYEFGKSSGPTAFKMEIEVARGSGGAVTYLPETTVYWYYKIVAKNTNGEAILGGKETPWFARAGKISWNYGSPAVYTEIPVQGGQQMTLTATNVRATSMTLNWSSYSGANQYILRRNGVEIYRGSALTFNDTGLTSGTVYTYSVCAVDSMGETYPTTITQMAKDYAQAVMIGDIQSPGLWTRYGDGRKGKEIGFALRWLSGPYAGVNPGSSYRDLDLAGIDAYFAVSVADPGMTHFTQAQLDQFRNDTMPLPTTFHDLTTVNRTSVRYKKISDMNVSQPPNFTQNPYWYSYIAAGVWNTAVMFSTPGDNEFVPTKLHIFVKLVARNANGEAILGGKETPWIEDSQTNGTSG